MWGSLVAPHRGQVLRGGAERVQAEARRLRLFAFDVFFLGTAMFSVPLLVRIGGRRRRTRERARGDGRERESLAGATRREPSGPTGWFGGTGHSSNDRSSRAAQRGSRG